MTERYSDLGGGCPDRWEGVLDNKCVECGADPGQKCWNKLSDKPKKVPCWRRAKVLL